MRSYAIVGNGVAAVGCIEGIRSVDADGPITIISEETHETYCRPLISYLLEGKTDTERMRYRDADFFDRMGCTVLYGSRAARIASDGTAVVLESGETVHCDALCIATGSSPFVPRFEGIETVPKRFSFMTLDDALALDGALEASSRVLIVGAGLIGLKCAEGICGRVASVTVCDLADRVLSSILDAECAMLMQRNLEQNGIRFMLGDSVSRFEGSRAVMLHGDSVDFDLVVLAVGVRANTGLIADIGGEVGRGIVVDDRMQTSIPGIYAAGDCTEGNDISLGQRRVIAILPNAYLQGHAAGVNMAGGDEVFDKAIPMNSIGFFGLHAMTAGTYTGEVYEEGNGTSVKRLFWENNLLKGFILIGSNERAGIYTSLIRERTPLSSIDFELLKTSATTTAFPRAQRRKKFGGVV